MIICLRCHASYDPDGTAGDSIVAKAWRWGITEDGWGHICEEFGRAGNMARCKEVEEGSIGPEGWVGPVPQEEPEREPGLRMPCATVLPVVEEEDGRAWETVGDPTPHHPDPPWDETPAERAW